jgi:hypothetical protein
MNRWFGANEVKRANQTIAISLVFLQVVCQRGPLAQQPGSGRHEGKSILSNEHIFERLHQLTARL